MLLSNKLKLYFMFFHLKIKSDRFEIVIGVKNTKAGGRAGFLLSAIDRLGSSIIIIRTTEFAFVHKANCVFARS